MCVSVVYSTAVLVISPGLNIDCPQAISISEEKLLAEMRVLGVEIIIEGIVKCRWWVEMNADD
jgi:hypothetical protein